MPEFRIVTHVSHDEAMESAYLDASGADIRDRIDYEPKSGPRLLEPGCPDCDCDDPTALPGLADECDCPCHGEGLAE